MPKRASSDATGMSHRAREADAAAEHVAVDPPHHRLGKVTERGKQMRELLGFGDVLLEAHLPGGLHGRDVGAGAERRTATAQHHDPHRLVMGQAVERRIELGEQLRRERVVLLGTVQPRRGPPRRRASLRSAMA